MLDYIHEYIIKMVLSMFSYVWSTCSCRGVGIHYSESVHVVSVARGDGAIQLVLHDGQLLGDPVNLTLDPLVIVRYFFELLKHLLLFFG